MANLGYIQVTRECNQKCRFCSNPPTTRNISVRYIKQLIDNYIRENYVGVIFTGGEPTLYPYLTELIEYATKKKFHSRIITNGQNISNFGYLKSLADLGLKHICLSIYSDDSNIQGFLTNSEESLNNIKRSLKNIEKLRINVDIITVINKYNADHLSRIVKWLVGDYPFIYHFVWNNLDPLMNRASINIDTIPRLNDFELELHRAMAYIQNHDRTFRVERVPLCYMAEFAHCSTETRKIVKNEERMTYFLDEKGLIRQKGWYYKKAKCCEVCSLNEICAGLYQMDIHYFSKELYPVFVSKEDIIRCILKNE